MAPGSRPPLTSRIRASFDGGKRSKSERPPSAHGNGNDNGNGAVVAQDPDSLRAAIDEAINSEAFQNAIATNLANIIKPSIKSALDTIQPLVESVYSHELLLRKANRSVEDVLIRLDNTSRRESRAIYDESDAGGVTPTPNHDVKDLGTDQTSAITSADFEELKTLIVNDNAKTTKVVEELSSSLEATNAKVLEVMKGIDEIHATIKPTRDRVSGLYNSSEQSNTIFAVMQAQMDQLQVEIRQVMDAVGQDIGKNVDAIHKQTAVYDPSLLPIHSTKLDEISTDLAALKIHSENVVTGMDAHSRALAEIRESAPHQDVLSALQKSNDAHASHAAALDIHGATLGDIKAAATAHSTALENHGSSVEDLRSVVVAPAVVADNSALESQIGSIVGTLNEQRSTLEEVKAQNNAYATALELHGNTLEKIKSPVSTSSPSFDTSGLESQLISMKETLDNHGSVLDDIKASANSHAAALETHGATLDELKSLTPPTIDVNVDNSGLHSQIDALVSTIDLHASALDEIKAQSISHATALGTHGASLDGLKSMGATSLDTSGLESRMDALSSTLNSHTSALDEIKAHHTSHATALDEVKALNNTHLAGLDDIKASNSSVAVALSEMQASTNAHRSLLDNIKTSNVNSSAVIPVETPMSPAMDGLFTTIVIALEEHTILLNEIKEEVSTEISAEILTSLHNVGQTQTTHSDLLAEIREADVSAEILTLLHASNESHDRHAAELNEIKTASRSGSLEPVAEESKLGDLHEKLGNMMISLEEQKTTLSAMNNNDSHTEILTNLQSLRSIVEESRASTDEHGNLVKDLHSSTKETHSSLTAAIGALTVGSAAGVEASSLLTKDDAGLMEEVKVVRAIVEKNETSIESMSLIIRKVENQIDINHTTVTTSINTLSDELKAEIDATGTEITDSFHSLNSDITALKLAAISPALEETGKEVKSISAQLSALDGKVGHTGIQVTALGDGVHLNDKGLDQLKEHASSKDLSDESIPEGEWFSSPKSRNAVRTKELDRESISEPPMTPIEEDKDGEEDEEADSEPAKRDMRHLYLNPKINFSNENLMNKHEDDPLEKEGLESPPHLSPVDHEHQERALSPRESVDVFKYLLDDDIATSSVAASHKAESVLSEGEEEEDGSGAKETPTSHQETKKTDSKDKDTEEEEYDTLSSIKSTYPNAPYETIGVSRPHMFSRESDIGELPEHGDEEHELLPPTPAPRSSSEEGKPKELFQEPTSISPTPPFVKGFTNDPFAHNKTSSEEISLPLAESESEAGEESDNETTPEATEKRTRRRRKLAIKVHSSDEEDEADDEDKGVNEASEKDVKSTEEKDDKSSEEEVGSEDSTKHEVEVASAATVEKASVIFNPSPTASKASSDLLSPISKKEESEGEDEVS